MNEPLDELYFKWLYSQVGNVKLKNPSRTYWSLLRILHRKEFVWIIPNDDNRLEDGRDLRDQFVDAEGLYNVDPIWLSLGCSMLEMLIALAKVLSFEDDRRDAGDWFWELLRNLNLLVCTDNYELDHAAINQTLDNVIWRIYRRDGDGGLFPLRRPRKDQRDEELWYQMNAYILENN